jgi:hypothetical protein
VTEIAVSGEAEGAADEDGSEQEHQRLLLAALHGNSLLAAEQEADARFPVVL